MSSFFTNFLGNPSWIPHEYLGIEQFSGFPSGYVAEVRRNLKQVVSETPHVSVILTTYNEEANVIRCLDTIARNKTKYPFEVIVVNNNSTDNTIAALRALDIEYHEQPVQGSGPARQMGIEKAKGKYILLGDADCLYPDSWIEDMTRLLESRDTAVVYGRYCFLSEKDSSPRWQLSLYEMIRDLSMEMRHFKRPFLNAYGISMAFHREQALKEGFITDSRRGNDGRMCYDLMKYGKVKRLRKYRSAAWTGTRTLLRDGSFARAFWKRIVKHASIIQENFYRLPDHDTKESKNGHRTLDGSIHRTRKKTKVASTSSHG